VGLNMSKPRVLVWDLPTRVFHWLLTGGLSSCFLFALFADEHSVGFSAHMIIGIVVGALLALRVAWGFVGSRYARFASLIHSPASVVQYVLGAFTGREERHVGHNPGSSCVIVAMLLLAGLTVVTGLMMSFGMEAGEELHSAFAYTLAAFVAVHVAGVAWHSFRRRENVTLSMITGRKEGELSDAIASSHPIVGLVFLATAISLGVALFRNFEPSKQQTTIPFVNLVIPLGESGNGGENDD
jgi:cytochrome b